jgi:cytoplasmic iron level regulating protein YaaA (DUF328/UPF0246 family)
LVIFSGLWGVLRIDDPVPPYRLAMGVKIPALGALAALWRPELSAAMRPGGLMVDMRSAPYAAAWRPRAPMVTVGVVRERIVAGTVRRSVVSHMAKATRGRIARDLLVAGGEPDTPEDLAKILSDLGHFVELTEPSRLGGAWKAEVILHEQD